MPWAAKNHILCYNQFRMISLQQIDPQLPSIDILTKKDGGWGYILPSYPSVAGRPDPRSFDGYGLYLSLCNKESVALLGARAIRSPALYLEPTQLRVWALLGAHAIKCLPSS